MKLQEGFCRPDRWEHGTNAPIAIRRDHGEQPDIVKRVA